MFTRGANKSAIYFCGVVIVWLGLTTQSPEGLILSTILVPIYWFFQIDFYTITVVFFFHPHLLSDLFVQLLILLKIGTFDLILFIHQIQAVIQNPWLSGRQINSHRGVLHSRMDWYLFSSESTSSNVLNVICWIGWFGVLVQAPGPSNVFSTI